MMQALAVGLRIVANDMASRTLTSVGRGFENLKGKAERLKTSVVALNNSLKQLSPIGLAAGAALAFAQSAAMDFEHAMAGVRAVLLGTSEQDLAALQQEVLRLGATTTKSATEVAQGAELLARAGFSAIEVTRGLSGVISAAEADGIGLAQATNVITNTMRAFALETEQAVHVADVLALTSARTNTNMIQLGEGMRYVAPIAAQLGQTVEDTSFMLGLLANMGLQASIGGTALKNMLTRFSSASEEELAILEQMGVAVQDLEGNLLPLPGIVEQLAAGLPMLGGNLEQSAFLADLFGLRGMQAASNLVTGFETMQDPVVSSTGEVTSSFEDLRNQINNAGGAAEEMAKTRLDSLRGAFVLIKSAIEGARIGTFSGTLSLLRPSALSFAEAMSRVAEGAENTSAVLYGDYLPTMDETNLLNAEGTVFFLELGASIRETIDEITAFGIAVGTYLVGVLDQAFGEGAGARIGRFGAITTVVLAGLAAAFIAIKFVVIPVVGAIISLVSGLVAVGGAIPFVALGVFAAYLQGTREEGETFGQRLSRAFAQLKASWDAFASGFMFVYEGYLKPAFGRLVEAGNSLIEAFRPAFEVIAGGAGQSGMIFTGLGATIAGVVGLIIDVIALLIQGIAAVSGFIVRNFVAPFVDGFVRIYQGFENILTGAESLPRALRRIFSGVARIVMQTLLAPITRGVMAIAEGMRAIGVISSEQLNSIRRVMTDPIGLPPAEDQADQRESREANREASRAASARRAAMVEGNRTPNVIVEPPETRVQGTINTRVSLDSREVSAATSRREFELAQRGGASLNPWQQGAVWGGGPVIIPQG